MRDGDQDLVVATFVADFKLYENRGASGHWLQIELARDGGPVLGTRVAVTAGNHTQYRVVNAKADFLSQDTRTLHLGLAEEETATVRVVWPDGTRRVLDSVAADRRILIRHNGSVEQVGAGR